MYQKRKNFKRIPSGYSNFYEVFKQHSSVNFGMYVYYELLLTFKITHPLKYVYKSKMYCSRKNFVFLFGALINLTVRVDAYFHPIRMTYPIQPGPFFLAAPNWGKARQTLSLPQNLSNWADVITVRSPFSSSIILPWGKPSNLWTSLV